MIRGMGKVWMDFLTYLRTHFPSIGQDVEASLKGILKGKWCSCRCRYQYSIRLTVCLDVIVINTQCSVGLLPVNVTVPCYGCSSCQGWSVQLSRDLLLRHQLPRSTRRDYVPLLRQTKPNLTFIFSLWTFFHSFHNLPLIGLDDFQALPLALVAITVCMLPLLRAYMCKEISADWFSFGVFFLLCLAPRELCVSSDWLAEERAEEGAEIWFAFLLCVWSDEKKEEKRRQRLKLTEAAVSVSNGGKC